MIVNLFTAHFTPPKAKVGQALIANSLDLEYAKMIDKELASRVFWQSDIFLKSKNQIALEQWQVDEWTVGRQSSCCRAD
jgi:hypothetical protein